MGAASCSLSELSGVRPPRFLRACACCPFPTSMPTLPGQQAPLASSAFCLDCLPPNPLTTSVDQNAEGCSHISSVRSRCYAFLHICLILARPCALNVPVSCVELPLDFPFSSAFLIGGIGYFYYRSSKGLLSRFIRILKLHQPYGTFLA